MTKLDLSSRLDAVSAKAEALKVPLETRLALEAAAEIVAEKLSTAEQAKIEKGDKKNAKKDKVWVDVTSQPEKHKNSYMGRASFYWKNDPDKHKHSVNITLDGPAKLSIKGKDLKVDPKEGESFTWGEEREDQGTEADKDQVTKLDPNADENKDGITDAARVGIPAASMSPPPKLHRLNGLNEAQQKVEEDWNSQIESNTDAMTDAYLKSVMDDAAASGGPPEFVTDNVKLLQPDYRGKQQEFTDKEGKKKMVATPETQAWRAKNNVLLHQGANAVAKKAFLKTLDDLAKLPDGDPRKSVLVTSGGVGSGKGYALKKGPDQAKALKANAGAVWDAAGEQNATENTWVLEEAKKRGIKSTFMFLDAPPERQWADPKMGVVQRAADPEGEGRMVDARLFADSYSLGPKNFKAFQEKHDKKLGGSGEADFLVINTWEEGEKGPKMVIADKVDDRSANADSEKLYEFATKVIQTKAPTEAIKEGATIGQKIWGPPKAEKAEKTTARALTVSAVVSRAQWRMVMAADIKDAAKSPLHKLLVKNFQENLDNLDQFLEEENVSFNKKVEHFEKHGLVYDKDGKLVLPKKK
jgi:hypothetical protein